MKQEITILDSSKYCDLRDKPKDNDMEQRINLEGILDEKIGWLGEDVIEQVNVDDIKSAIQEAVTKAVEATKKEIIEALEKMSNQYEVIDGCYVIQKTTLDHYIEELSLNNY